MLTNLVRVLHVEDNSVQQELIARQLADVNEYRFRIAYAAANWVLQPISSSLWPKTNYLGPSWSPWAIILPRPSICPPRRTAAPTRLAIAP